jgi:aldehyde:ferredoxin oxidoreductase
MFNNKIIRVDLSQQKITDESLPEKYQYVGGRALTAAIISDEVPPTCHPLGKSNKIVIATGLFAGTPFPCGNRCSIGAKSPLTGGIKESNVGGTVAFKLSRLNIRAVVIEGQPAENQSLYILKLDINGGQLIPADEYRGDKTYKLASDMRQRFGTKIGLLMIGPAGELQLAAAGIAATDPRGNPCDYAGRGGMGAVLGSKHIKAIVIDDKAAQSEVQYFDRQKFVSISREFTRQLKKNKKALHEFGTPIEIEMSNELGYLPTRNYSTGHFESAEKIGGETMRQRIDERGGPGGQACTPGCPIACKHTYVDPNSRYITSSLEYETIALLGSNCGIDDLDAIAKMDRICDEVGVDTMEMGATIGVVMEAGRLPFGDAEGAISLLEEIAKNTSMGRIIGNGAEIAGKVFGVERVPTVKGQGMAAYDPRSNKGIGVTYASSPMGADHTAGCAMPGRTGFDSSKTYDPLKPDGQPELSLDLQIMVAIIDSMGVCFFVGLEIETLNILAEALNARYDQNVTFYDMVELGTDILVNEHRFNLAAGSPMIERLPDFFEIEPLSPHETLFDVNKDAIEAELYNKLKL